MAESTTKRKKRTANPQQQKYLHLTNGAVHTITGFDGKYIICGEKKFAASSPYIKQIVDEEGEADG